MKHEKHTKIWTERSFYFAITHTPAPRTLRQIWVFFVSRSPKYKKLPLVQTMSSLLCLTSLDCPSDSTRPYICSMFFKLLENNKKHKSGIQVLRQLIAQLNWDYLLAVPPTELEKIKAWSIQTQQQNSRKIVHHQLIICLYCMLHTFSFELVHWIKL